MLNSVGCIKCAFDKKLCFDSIYFQNVRFSRIYYVQCFAVLYQTRFELLFSLILIYIQLIRICRMLSINSKGSEISKGENTV